MKGKEQENYNEWSLWAENVPPGSNLKSWDRQDLLERYPKCVTNCRRRGNKGIILSVAGHLSELPECWERCKVLVAFNREEDQRNPGAAKAKAMMAKPSKMHQTMMAKRGVSSKSPSSGKNHSWKNQTKPPACAPPQQLGPQQRIVPMNTILTCLLYTSDAADE